VPKDDVDFDAIERAIQAVAKGAETTKKDLERQVETPRDHVEVAKHALAGLEGQDASGG